MFEIYICGETQNTNVTLITCLFAYAISNCEDGFIDAISTPLNNNKFGNELIKFVKTRRNLLTFKERISFINSLI